MPIRDDCVWWNRLGDAAQIGTSEIGVNCVWDNTPTYNAGKFDNGIYSNNANNRVRTYSFASSLVNNWRQFIVEFWLRTDYNLVAGIPSDATTHGMFSYYQNSDNRLRWVLDSAWRIDLGARIGAVWYNHRLIQANWSSGTDAHFLVAVNNAGIDGGADQFRLYVNNGLVYNSANDYANWSTSQSIYLLVQATIGAIVTPLNGVLDNIKIYDSTAQLAGILANRETEGFPASGYPISNKFNFQRFNSAN